VNRRNASRVVSTQNGDSARRFSGVEIPSLNMEIMSCQVKSLSGRFETENRNGDQQGESDMNRRFDSFQSLETPPETPLETAFKTNI